MLTPATSAITPRTSTSSYPGTPDQVRIIRADLRQLLASCPHADDIILCASELAANAALHSNSAAPGGIITIHAEARPGEHVRIEARDLPSLRWQLDQAERGEPEEREPRRPK